MIPGPGYKTLMEKYGCSAKLIQRCGGLKRLRTLPEESVRLLLTKPIKASVDRSLIRRGLCMSGVPGKPLIPPHAPELTEFALGDPEVFE